MTSLSDLIQETKRHLQSYQREPMNKLAAGLTSIGETITLQYDAAQIQPGAYLQVDLELLYVWAVDSAAKTATIGRAQLGSVAAAHGAGAVVTVNPKFPDFAIAKAINDDLADLCSPVNGLYAVKSVQLTATTNSAGYDLAGATNLLEVLDIRMKHQGQPRDWTPVTNFELSRQVSATDFPSCLLYTSPSPRDS